MESSEEIKHLLREIRDIQQAHLAEYKRIAEESVALQTRAVARQEQVSRLYKGMVVVGGVLITAVLIAIFYVLSFL